MIIGKNNLAQIKEWCEKGHWFVYTQSNEYHLFVDLVIKPHAIFIETVCVNTIGKVEHRAFEVSMYDVELEPIKYLHITREKQIEIGKIKDQILEAKKRREEKHTPQNPSHYKGEIEAIDAIRVATKDLKGIQATDTGNILKYMWRWKKKNGVEDLKKAQWYLQHLINEVENEKQDEADNFLDVHTMD